MRALPLVLLIAAASPVVAAEPSPPADKVVTGEISGADNQTYKEVPFDVPAGVERITVTLAYDKANKTVVDLGLWDPHAFRGWSGGSRDRFTIAPSDATPGYLAGAIPAGRWHVELGVPNARPGSRSTYRLAIHFDRGNAHHASAAIADPPLKQAPGWYRGDLHMHDANSDGTCVSQSGKRVPCPLFRTVEAAAKAGLDFIAVTDHNTVSHFGALRELQPFYDQLLLIPGTEITTFHGHANIFGESRFVDFRVGTPAVPNPTTLERKVAEAGAILSINHPNSPSGEICMGCGWTWPETDYAGVTAVEAVNGNVAEGPLAGVGFWYARLNEGHRLTGIAGSDSHDPDAPAGKPPVGHPTTVVHAAALSIPAILEGIRAGNVFIDVQGTRERMLGIEASDGAERVGMGGTLHPASSSIRVAVVTAGVEDGVVQLIANGVPVGGGEAHIGAANRQAELTLERTKACGWISANVLDRARHPLLIGNPIYISCRSGAL
jgi:hypothetical protein